MVAPLRLSMKAFLRTPIRQLSMGSGNIWLAEKMGGQEFTRENQGIIVMFAAHTAMAIIGTAGLEPTRAMPSNSVPEQPVGALAVSANSTTP